MSSAFLSPPPPPVFFFFFFFLVFLVGASSVIPWAAKKAAAASIAFPEAGAVVDAGAVGADVAGVSVVGVTVTFDVASRSASQSSSCWGVVVCLDPPFLFFFLGILGGIGCLDWRMGREIWYYTNG